jgi:2,4-dienoyl-CoA reductase-like NADH-dependent reductase (Old Yellow Enzyme family)
MSGVTLSKLFDPIFLRSVAVPNRIWMSPMCTYSAAADGPLTGVPTDWHLTHLASRAAGGAGLIMVEATAVRADGRISPWDLGLWNTEQEKAFARITQSISALGAVPAIQLAHAGRKASTDRPWLTGGHLSSRQGGWETVGPSPMPYGDAPAPHELGIPEIKELVVDFAQAARRALAAGFKVVEIHGAHGYLINSFLSPHTNRRTDEYGGSFENRIRFALEITDAVREVWPADLPLLFRVSATDWLTENTDDPREGWTSDDTVQLAAILADHGVDLIDASTGGAVPDADIPAGPGYQVRFADAVRNKAKVAAAAVGLIVHPEQAHDILAEERADVIFVGRQLLRDPYWPRHAATLLGREAHWPVQYGYAVSRDDSREPEATESAAAEPALISS